MSDASRRQTTHIEDRAYSLSGIIQVHMLLLYGEREMAFQSLQEELIRCSSDMFIFTSAGSLLARTRMVVNLALISSALRTPLPHHTLSRIEV